MKASSNSEGQLLALAAKVGMRKAGIGGELEVVNESGCAKKGSRFERVRIGV